MWRLSQDRRHVGRNRDALASILDVSGETAGPAAIANNNPEVADTVDVGWRYYGSRLSASVDAYASNLKNKQVSGFDEASSATVYLSVPELQRPVSPPPIVHETVVAA